MKSYFYSIVTLFCILLLPGCGVLDTLSLAGHVAGGEIKGKSISHNFETSLTSKSQVLTIYKKIGSELGWEITTDSPDVIVWQVGKTSIVQEYFGKTSETSFYASIIQNSQSDKTLVLRIAGSISGNYNDASKENIDKALAAFEEKLAVHLKEAGHSFIKKED